VPAILIGVTFVWSATQTRSDNRREDRRIAADRAAAEEARQHATLRAYLDQMSGLMLREKLLPPSRAARPGRSRVPSPSPRFAAWTENERPRSCASCTRPNSWISRTSASPSSAAYSHTTLISTGSSPIYLPTSGRSFSACTRRFSTRCPSASWRTSSCPQRNWRGFAEKLAAPESYDTPRELDLRTPERSGWVDVLWRGVAADRRLLLAKTPVERRRPRYLVLAGNSVAGAALKRVSPHPRFAAGPSPIDWSVKPSSRPTPLGAYLKMAGRSLLSPPCGKCSLPPLGVPREARPASLSRRLHRPVLAV